MLQQPLIIMIPDAKKNEIIFQLNTLNPQQVDQVMEYVKNVINTQRDKNKKLKRQALVQIRKALRKPL